MKRQLALLATAVVAVLLTGCSSEAPKAPEKKEVKPAVPVGAQTAMFEMYKVARTWAPDLLLLKLENADIEGVKPEPGKFGAWKATFASPSKKLRHDFSYSVIETSSVRKGVTPGPESSYVISNLQRPFNATEVKIDSTDALAEAKKNKDIGAYAAKNPDMPVQFQLEWTMQTPKPAFRVIWGTSISSSNASAYIDAAKGEFLKKSH